MNETSLVAGSLQEHLPPPASDHTGRGGHRASASLRSGLGASTPQGRPQTDTPAGHREHPKQTCTLTDDPASPEGSARGSVPAAFLCRHRGAVLSNSLVVEPTQSRTGSVASRKREVHRQAAPRGHPNLTARACRCPTTRHIGTLGVTPQLFERAPGNLPRKGLPPPPAIRGPSTQQPPAPREQPPAQAAALAQAGTLRTAFRAESWPAGSRDQPHSAAPATLTTQGTRHAFPHQDAPQNHGFLISC